MFKRLVLVFLILWPMGALCAETGDQVTVILYHRVGDSRYPSTNVSMEAFRAQMEHLKNDGYNVITTADLEAFLHGRGTVPPKAVVIQFDDGFRSVYENGVPVLEEFGYPYTVFIPTGAIEKNYGDYVTWEMLKEMSDRGAEIGAHGHEHLRLGTRKGGETIAEYRKRISREFGRSKQILEEKGFDPRWIAYPYGEYGEEIMEVARQSGFAVGFAQDPGAVAANTNKFMVSRFAVVGGYSDMKTFRARIGYSPLVFEQMIPPPGELDTSSPGAFGAVPANPDRYVKGAVNLFVSELGRLDAGYKGRDEGFRAESGAKLKRRMNRVLISVKDKKTGRFALGSWVIMNGENK